MSDIQDICSNIPVSDSTVEESEDIYGRTVLNGLDVKIASIILASLVNSEPVNINEFTYEYDVSEDRIKSKINILISEVR